MKFETLSKNVTPIEEAKYEDVESSPIKAALPSIETKEYEDYTYTSDFNRNRVLHSRFDKKRNLLHKIPNYKKIKT